MSSVAATAEIGDSQRFMMSTGLGLYNFFAGLAILFVFWWIGVYLVTLDPGMAHFADVRRMRIRVVIAGFLIALSA